MFDHIFVFQTSVFAAQVSVESVCLEERSILANLERYTIEMDEKVVPDPCFVLLPRIGSRLHP